jgi:hypothetical protein
MFTRYRPTALMAPSVSEMAASPDRCRPSSTSVSESRLLLCPWESARRLFLDRDGGTSYKGPLIVPPPGDWSVSKLLAADWSLCSCDTASFRALCLDCCIVRGPNDVSGGLHDGARSESGVRQGIPRLLAGTCCDQALPLVCWCWRSASVPPSAPASRGVQPAATDQAWRQR